MIRDPHGGMFSPRVLCSRHRLRASGVCSMAILRSRQRSIAKCVRYVVGGARLAPTSASWNPTIDELQTLPPGPVVNSVLRTPDGLVNLRPNAMSRPRKATGLQKLLVCSPPRRRPEAQMH